MLTWSVLVPLAAAGTILHYPLYRLIGFLGVRLAHGEDELIATIKLIGGGGFFPLLWIALPLGREHWARTRLAMLAFILPPPPAPPPLPTDTPLHTLLSNTP